MVRSFGRSACAQRWRRVGSVAATCCFIACAWPQAPTNPSLNAQLLVAARNGDMAAVERALSQGAAPNSRNRLGKSALVLACEQGNAALAATLQRAGADVNLASL